MRESAIKHKNVKFLPKKLMTIIEELLEKQMHLQVLEVREENQESNKASS